MSSKGEIGAEAQIILHFPSKKEARAAFFALKAEEEFSHRGISQVAIDGAHLKILIKAQDPVSLRASLNSYLRLAQVIKSVEQDTE
ncbi:MAG: KEOPS complex subunit Pcc1 [Candidatus Micrarchaeota archaeon]|nr:KEOPS complex subunit Pcc1 [Candidatus Micrarchaeota archaeon]